MPQPATVRRQHVAEDILAKAASLFDNLGYGMTSLQDIADAVGIARPSLYHYFKSKDEILVMLVERTSANREAAVAEIKTMAAPPRDRLAALLHRVGAAIGTNPIGLRLALNYGGSLPPAVQRRSVRSRRLMFELIASVLSDGVDNGSLRPMEPRETAAMIIASLSGLQYQDIGGVHMDADRAAALLARTILDGLSQPDERQASTAAAAIQRLRDDLDVLEHQIRRADS
ncbi:MAG TPA: TetR/AcrR family transcriptional regulator [Ilumatobacteraceae bacterium]